MNIDPHRDEPDRFELYERPRYRFSLSRRAFVQVVSAGLFITTAGGDVFAQREPGAGDAAERLHIGEDGIVTVFTSKVEVGQGSRTQLAQAAAEEMHVPFHQIRMVMADTARVPDDGGTYGSQTTPRTVPAVREAAAAAREALIELACVHWGVARDGAMMREGIIEHPSGTRMSVAELVRAVADVNHRLGDEQSAPPPTPPASWSVLGQPVPKANASDIVTGAHKYPSDIVLPDMLYGAVVRPPAYNARLVSIDTGTPVEGASVIRDGDFVGCTAPTGAAARAARAKVAATARWETQPHPSSQELFSYLKAHTREGSGRSGPREENEGDVDAAIAAATEVVRASYEVPYIQHAPMEPRAAAAQWDDDALTVWTGTQRPSGVREELAETFSIPQDRVRVIVPDTGGGFGGKHTGDAAVEAARLAKGTERPVAVHWAREDEFTWAYFRPAALLELAAAFNREGRVTAWDFANYNSGTAGIDCPYAFPCKRIRFLPCESPLRAGSYRALAATANNFAREAFIDRLAAARKQDPLAFRLEYLAEGRLRDVLNAAASSFGWMDTTARPAGAKGVGIACGTEKGSFVATCVEVAMGDGAKRPAIQRVTVAFDCGPVHHPKNLRAQVEGAIVMGLGAVLREAMVFADGKIENNNFKQYRVPRFKDVPPIEVIIVDRPDVESAGAGETPIIALAPAVANAVFHATGAAPAALPIAESSRA